MVDRTLIDLTRLKEALAFREDGFTPWNEEKELFIAAARAYLEVAQREIPVVDDKAMLQVIDERDAAQEALSQAYYLITGRSPEWSNHFGYAEALEDIEDAQRLLRESIPKREAQPSKVLLNEEDLAHRISTVISKNFECEDVPGFYDDMTVQIIEAIEPHLKAIYDNGYRSGMLQERAIQASTKGEIFKDKCADGCVIDKAVKAFTSDIEGGQL